MGWLEIFQNESELIADGDINNLTVKSVLVVDDEIHITDTLGRFLQDSGYQVYMASNAVEALEIFRIRQPRIVVTDLMMPGMSGIDFIKAIRETDWDTQIIVLTGHGDMDTAITALRHQVAEFLLKPVDLLVLRHAVEKAIIHIRLKEEIREYTEELERLYAEIRGNKEHVEAIFKHAPVAVMTYNANGEILTWNIKAGLITGYALEEALSKKLSDLFVLAGPLFTEEELQFTEISQRTQVNQILTHKHEMRYVERAGKVLKNGQGEVISVIETFMDVTERMQDERLLEKRYLQVQIINEIGKRIAASTTISDLLGFISNRLVKTFFESATVAIFLGDGQEKIRLETVAGISRNDFLKQFVSNKVLQSSGSVIHHVAESKTRVLNDEKGNLKALSPDRPAFFAFPIATQSKLYGVLYIENSELMVLDDGDIFLLEAIAEYIAISMDRLALIEKITSQNEMLEEQATHLKNALGQVEQQKNIIEEKNKQLEQDLIKAGDLQKSLLPETLPDTESVHFAASFTPSHQLGGDYYDVFAINDHMTGFLIADATGHGVSSAMLSAMFKMTMSKYAKTETDPGKVFEYLNHDFCNVLQTGDFFTAFYGIIDHKNNELIYSNAAHPLPLLFDYSSKDILALDSEGFLLGVMEEGITYETRKCSINNSMRLFVYTDGLQEAINREGEQFGDERIEKAMRKYSRLKRRTFLEKIVNDLKEYTGEQSGTFDDDLTLMVVDIAK